MPAPLAVSKTNTQSAPIRSATGHPRPNPTPTFDEHQENLHRIEFEAPLSSAADSELHKFQREQGQGRFSIDLSLELERQLEMESPPVTPGHDATTHPETTSPASKKRGDGGINDLLPDPEILANIITQLRHSLNDMTKERDELVKLMESANTQEANAKDALQVMTDKATEAEEELTALRKKAREDEEQIALLRTKVEESRRGLMRLQTENRRQSMAPIDVSRASSATFSSFAGPTSSKRASFVPLTGSIHGKPGHRRAGSVIEPALGSSPLGSFPTPDPTPSPQVRAFNIASAEAALSGAPSSSRRHSGIFGRQSPPHDDLLHQPGSAEGPAASSAELEALRKEIQTLKLDLDTAKHDLQEANEAKEASETCVIALRDFIAENNVGAAGATSAMKLPPPPMMAAPEEPAADPRKTGSAWGFKLWGNGSVDSPLRSSSAPYSASVAQSSSMQTSATVDPPATATIGAAPLSRKLGSFFSSRSSISSNQSREQAPSQLPQLQTNAAVSRVQSQRDSIYSYSDASSVAEPISPGSDINGLGTAPFQKPHIAEYAGSTAAKDITDLDGAPIHVSISAADMESLR
ncbi:hypothetical protein M413DRAFT_442868 [Hebeloma cylindrosporum]|uniref:Uncharacterized protein n=1 Tax=Hebeloma cylindrosporum TaxID=76867 RepID=A0A0C3C7Q9_HEBCY|nr:hypothetical protein M413DRAFT_442868 [Hebeloma cylindrosporum h7]